MKATPSCSRHKDRPVAPLGCQQCARIAIETEIVTRVIDALLAKGYHLAINDQGGDDDIRPEKPTKDRALIRAEAMETDDDFLAVYELEDDPLPLGYVRFVYGNDGYDVICDYTTNLEAVLAPINDYIEREVAP